ncbi:MAG TPA: DUF2142 domain-containing protein [Planctomycetota bacterium]|nr:DUF2142 domain-containing protein [Planctomycetota bacterium]
MSAEVEPAMTRRRTTWLLLAAAALNGLVYLALSTPWMGEDEPWQFEYVSYVADGHLPGGGTPIVPGGPGRADPRQTTSSSQLQALHRIGGLTPEIVAARQTEILESMRRHGYYRRVDWAGVDDLRRNFDQVVLNSTATIYPPLYFLLAGTWMRLWGAQDVDGQMWSVRALSWLLYVGTVAAALAFARTLFDDERVALCVAALVAFLPMSARQAAIVNNDVLAKFLSAVVLWLAARWLTRRGRPWELLVGLGVCALALQTKTTVTAAVAAFALACLLRFERIGTRLGPLLVALGLMAALGFVVLRIVFANSPSMPHSVMGFAAGLDKSLTLDNLSDFGRTLAGSFGWESRFLPGALNLLLGLTLFGALARLFAARARVGQAQVFVWLALGLAVQVGLILLRGGPSKGRYLMPTLPLLAALVVGGLVLAADDRPRAVRRFAVALAIYAAYFLFGGLVVHEVLLLGA